MVKTVDEFEVKPLVLQYVYRFHGKSPKQGLLQLNESEEGQMNHTAAQL